MEFNQDGGAAWFATDKATGQKKVTQKGDNYWTGTITLNGQKYPFTMFFTKPENKTKPTQPDFNIKFNAPQHQMATELTPAKMPDIELSQIPF